MARGELQEKLCGRQGDVWVVGAQNAGKSSLINSLMGHKGGAKAKFAPLTAAPLPGTTIGCVELPGVLPAPHRMWDTPGIIQVSSLDPVQCWVCVSSVYVWVC